ncbi:MAG: hypothetical protein REI09_15400 [Candidatus Dactylopiibacterium sp.]|nr:hypothetical protein [Candidatus Dactylopiibacterium sp.]
MKPDHSDSYPVVLQNATARAPRGASAPRTDTGIPLHWFLGVMPTLALLIGLFAFRHDVALSVSASAHPALVYIIFGALAVGIALVYRTLYIASCERLRIDHLGEAANAVRALPPSNDYRAVYALLQQGSLKAPRAELVRRLADAQHGVEARLALPGYAAGALVGIGLVGTFIGLLGALRELGGMFSGMMHSSDAGTPADLFSGMLVKLQAPMQSMGTAFIASLYGVLGSLVLGVVLVVVGRAVSSLLSDVRERALALYDAAAEAAGPAGTQTDDSGPVLFEEMGLRHAALLKLIEAGAAETAQLRHATQAIASKSDAVLELLCQRVAHEETMQRFMSTGSHWLRAWSDISENLQALRNDLAQNERHGAREIGELTVALNALRADVQVLGNISERWQESARSQTEFMQAGNRSLLQNACVQIEAALSNARTTQQHDMHAMADAVTTCRAAFEHLSGKLDILLQEWLERDNRFTNRT